MLAAIGGKVPAAPIAKSALEIERYCAGSLDWDNAYGGLKPLLVCLVAPSNPGELGLIEDDSHKFMPEAPRVLQLPAKKRSRLRGRAHLGHQLIGRWRWRPQSTLRTRAARFSETNQLANIILWLCIGEG